MGSDFRTPWEQRGLTPRLIGSSNDAVNAAGNAVMDATLRDELAINDYGTVVRVCFDCDASPYLVFYKRISPVAEDLSLSNNMIYNWSNYNNLLNQDFKLYGSESDYLSDTNAWGTCSYSDSQSVTGSFGKCSPGAAIPDQSVRLGSKRVMFFMLTDCTRIPCTIREYSPTGYGPCETCPNNLITTHPMATSISDCSVCDVEYRLNGTYCVTCSKCQCRNPCKHVRPRHVRKRRGMRPLPCFETSCSSKQHA